MKMRQELTEIPGSLGQGRSLQKSPKAKEEAYEEGQNEGVWERSWM